MRTLPDRLVRAVPGVLFLALLVIALEIAVRTGAADKSFVPAPSAVASLIGSLLGSGSIWPPLAETTLLLFAGYGAGCALAIALGALMGYYRPVYLLFEPITELLRPIPKPALVPVLLLLLGLGTAMKVTVVALAAFFPVLINTIQGVRAVDPVLTDTARTFGHGDLAVLLRILLPASAPYILAGMRISLGISLVVLIIAEMVSGTGGLGDLILDMQRQFAVTESYAWLVIVAVLGFGLNLLFRWAERRLTFWSAPPSE
jgi:ABC-type nitrate/sulfonate/bicarbonate transport system permease component